VRPKGRHRRAPTGLALGAGGWWMVQIAGDGCALDRDRFDFVSPIGPSSLRSRWPNADSTSLYSRSSDFEGVKIEAVGGGASGGAEVPVGAKEVVRSDVRTRPATYQLL